MEIPTRVDGNSPTFWLNGKFHFLTSTGDKPVHLEGPDQFGFGSPQPVTIDRMDHMPIWIESAWVDDDGTVYGWYHHEPGGICVGNDLTAPEIGAVVSRDGGKSFEDLGIVLRSGETVDCSAKNGFFAGGHGDFSVIIDRERSYFYFLFTNYAGALEQQGIAMARLAFEDRASPQGRAMKFFEGGWTEPGLTGKVTPVLQTRVSWQRADTDSYWGPAIHWNTHLEKYVVLLNRACCEPNWPQHGIYVTFNADLSNPQAWSMPQLVLTEIVLGPGYYPQIMGVGPGESDTLSGEVARFYLQGRSDWEIVFSPLPPPGPDDTAEPDLPREESATRSTRRRR